MAFTILHLEQGSKAWHKFRKNKIGCSLAPILMGCGFETPLQYWKRKMKGLKKTKNSSAMMRGMLLEPFAREKAKKELGYDFYPTVVQSVEDPWRFASLDGFYQSGNHVEALEIKCPGEKDHQTALEGNVPKKYFPQLQHIADVLNIPSVHYYSFDGKEGVHLLVKKDPDYCQKIKLIEMQFLDCLIKKVPPEASDMDWIKISDSRAIKGAKRVVCIQKQIKKLEAEKKTIYDQFDSIVDHKKSLAGKIKLQRICKKGAVEWLEIPAVQEIVKTIDIDSYRAYDSFYWKVEQ